MNKEYNDGSKPVQNEYVNRPTPLEALNNIKNLFIGSSINPAQQFKIIETALNDAEKYKKAIEIIKKYDYMALCDYKYTYEEMKKYWDEETDYEEGDYPTKEEYELLKEVLK